MIENELQEGGRMLQSAVVADNDSVRARQMGSAIAYLEEQILLLNNQFSSTILNRWKYVETHR